MCISSYDTMRSMRDLNEVTVFVCCECTALYCLACFLYTLYCYYQVCNSGWPALMGTYLSCHPPISLTNCAATLIVLFWSNKLSHLLYYPLDQWRSQGAEGPCAETCDGPPVTKELSSLIIHLQLGPQQQGPQTDCGR